MKSKAPSNPPAIKALEYELVSDFSTLQRRRAIVILKELDQLTLRSGLSDRPKTVISCLRQHFHVHAGTERLARALQQFFRKPSHWESECMNGILSARGCSVGPLGFDEKRRSTRSLNTVKGRIVFG